MYCDECTRVCMHCSRSLEPHERACEDAARREVAAEVRRILTPVSARLFGDSAISRVERDSLAALVEQAMRVGGPSAPSSSQDGGA